MTDFTTIIKAMELIVGNVLLVVANIGVLQDELKWLTCRAFVSVKKTPSESQMEGESLYNCEICCGLFVRITAKHEIHNFTLL